MIDNREIPIGFTMELAQHSDALVRFSNLTREAQDSLAEGARNIHSRSEMQNYVENRLGSGGDSHEQKGFF